VVETHYQLEKLKDVAGSCNNDISDSWNLQQDERNETSVEGRAMHMVPLASYLGFQTSLDDMKGVEATRLSGGGRGPAAEPRSLLRSANRRESQNSKRAAHGCLPLFFLPLS
jgi:hypothetical protein